MGKMQLTWANGVIEEDGEVHESVKTKTYLLDKENL
jgi:hypothetical protein